VLNGYSEAFEQIFPCGLIHRVVSNWEIILIFKYYQSVTGLTVCFSETRWSMTSECKYYLV
jgi:hypothetical protein